MWCVLHDRGARLEEDEEKEGGERWNERGQEPYSDTGWRTKGTEHRRGETPLSVRMMEPAARVGSFMLQPWSAVWPRRRQAQSVKERYFLLPFPYYFFLFFPLLEPKESNIFISHRSRIWVMIHSHAVQITPSPPYSPNSLFIENSKMKGHCFILSMGSIHEIRFELSKKASKNILCM